MSAQSKADSSQWPFGWLLLALSANFVFEGLAKPGNLQRAITAVLVGATLILALGTAGVEKRLLRLAAAVILAIVAADLVALSVSGGETIFGIVALVNGVLVALAPAAVVVGAMRDLRTQGVVTLNALTATLCLYLLLGLFFAYTFEAIQHLGGGPFFANGDPATPANAVYFSFVTLTSVGYGDFTARTNLGHTLSVSEALLGQIYLVTVVATIVSRLVLRERSRP